MEFVTLKVIGPSVLGAVGSYHVATVSRHMDNPEAYAALFAAAPDMLAALRAAERTIKEMDGLPGMGRVEQKDSPWNDTLRMTRAAIAKAEGK